MNINKWDKYWLNVAVLTSHLSKDPNTKVGSVIVTPDNKQCSVGYNGFVSGLIETKEMWEKPNKYKYVIHSEINNISNCPFNTEGCKMYITVKPCHKCLAVLIQNGIKDVYYLDDYKNEECPDVIELYSTMINLIKCEL